MKKICFISLGCDKNLVDSEQMMSILKEAGYGFTDDAASSDAIIINSCCFIGDAKRESIDEIIEAGRLKEEGNIRFLIVTGCLAERYAEEIKKELPEVDAVVGTTAFDEIAALLDALFSESEKDEKRILKKDKDILTNPSVDRLISTPGHYEYLKIAEGCDKNCTYCIIPKIRGKYRSVPEERLIKDASLLADKGVKELILVAQETTLYGTDLYGKKTLPSLLGKLSEIPGIERIRLLYCYPEEIDEELIKAVSELPKVCNYLDIPIQHCSDRILKLMGRRATKEGITALIKRLRSLIPDISIRTTLITGFPGETEEEHREVLEFVKEMRFDRLGVFTYSPEEGTAAAKLPGQVEEEVKERRRDETMALQRDISLSINEGFMGKVLSCVIEGYHTEEKVYVARSYRDAPDVDGMVFIEGAPDGTLMTGDSVNVRINGFSEYDLQGELTDESAE